jgi:Glycosyl hydrolase family 99
MPGRRRLTGAREVELVLIALLLATITGCTPVPPPASAAPGPPTRAAALPAPDPAVQPAFPIRAAFYYGWFPEGWQQNSLSPYTRYSPELGLYDSGDRHTLSTQVRALVHGGFDAAIISWWGARQKSEERRVPALLDTAREVDPALRLALYYEEEGTADPTSEDLIRDLEYIRTRYFSAGNYLRVVGKPVLFVYNANDRDCAVVRRWQTAAAAVPVFLVMKVFPGWERCGVQPDGWHEYAPAASVETFIPADPRITGAVTISPGFWRADDARPLLARNLDRWRRNVATMRDSHADWQLVSSFNEWGEGTSVENAAEWTSASGYGSYLDVLHDAGG